jgi:hypothetical protein
MMEHGTVLLKVDWIIEIKNKPMELRSIEQKLVVAMDQVIRDHNLGSFGTVRVYLQDDSGMIVTASPNHYDTRSKELVVNKRESHTL